MKGAQAFLMADGKRLHLNHGPIDLIIEVTGRGRQDAYHSASTRFQTVLDELVEELPQLRAPGKSETVFSGTIAQRMQTAISPYCSHSFVTPMAAVAGSVADKVLEAICQCEDIDKAYVNNGGDVAFYLSKGEQVTVALAASTGSSLVIGSDDIWRGVATSGWRGRSHSFGIADSVTVIATNAASADVAATVIANAVDIADCLKIKRTSANELSPDSDLGAMLVTTHVDDLSEGEIQLALDNGAERANQLLQCGLIGGCCLQLGDAIKLVGQVPTLMANMKSTEKRELLHA